jgi:hypothetical protein
LWSSQKESRKVTCPFTSGGSSMSPLAGTPLGPCSSSRWCWLGPGAWAPWAHMGPSGRWHRQPGGTCVPAAPYWRLSSGRPRGGSGSRPSGAARPASAGAPAPLLDAPTAAPRKSLKWAAGSLLTLRCSPWSSQCNRASSPLALAIAASTWRSRWTMALCSQQPRMALRRQPMAAQGQHQTCRSVQLELTGPAAQRQVKWRYS